MPNSSLFTSESVCAGHPDKLCDQISDAIVDTVLGKDPMGRVAVETMATKNRLIISGEVSAKVPLDFARIAKTQINRLGYTDKNSGFSDQSVIEVYVHQQSSEIGLGVDHKGAGDQGMMFGYACTETPQFMPLPIMIAHALASSIDHARESRALPYLLPDGKTEVSVRYQHGQPVSLETVVLAVPHQEQVQLDQVAHDLYEQVVKPIAQKYHLGILEDRVIVNGTGVWHHGGPSTDTGVTGRKIVVDTYGGYARVGGGCFSGKDPTKVDRSGAYAARYIAKNIVANTLAEKAEVRLAYCIGQSKPLMQEVETFGTAKVSDNTIDNFVHSLLDLSVVGIIEGLDLRRPIYLSSAVYGHFGRHEFPWEKVISL